MRTMLLSRKVAKTIEVLRLGEADGGFQRTLSPGKLKGILRAVRGGVHVPGISVAVVGDRRIVIDGQHRLAAWMEAEFPLSVELVRMSMRRAKSSFLAANLKGTKVKKAHAFKIAETATCKFLRSEAQKNSASEMEIAAGALGITGKFLNYDTHLNGEKRVLARIFSQYTKDPRWEKREGIYRSHGTIQTVAYLCRGVSELRKVDRIVGAFRQINLSKDSPLGRMYGTSFYSQNQMRNFALKRIYQAVR